MRVDDFESAREVTKPADIEAVLSKRYGEGANSFWLSYEPEKLPAINIMVKGDLAYVHYFPQGDHPGLASVAKVPVGRPDESTVFFLSSGGEEEWMPNTAVVPFSDALKAAQESAISAALPKCIQWNSLVEGE
jgi:Immunity protein Imm1